MHGVTETDRFLGFEPTSQHRPQPLLGLLSGALAGLVATAPMSLFEGKAQSVSRSREGDNASEKVVREISQGVAGVEPPQEATRAGGVAAHFALGTIAGAAYGVAAEYEPKVTAGFGTLFGMAVMLLADDAMLTALRLAPPPQQRPASHHAYSLGSHLVYGAATEAGRRAIRSVLEPRFRSP